MYTHTNNLADVALAKLGLQNFSNAAWFDNYGLALYLLNDDSKCSLKAIKKRDKTAKGLIKYHPDVVDIEDVRKRITATKRVESFYSVLEKYEHPVTSTESRAVSLIPVFEHLSKDNIQDALQALAELPTDYLVEKTIWGQVIRFIVAAHSGHYDVAKNELSLLINRSQSKGQHAFLAVIIPGLCVKYLPEAHWPWQFKKATITWEGEEYHCMPMMLHNSEAEGGNEFMQIPWAERKPTHQVYARDSYGRKCQTVATAGANAIGSAASAVGNLAANATIQTVAAIARYHSKGRFKAFGLTTHMNELILRKDTQLPPNSSGYIISKDPESIEAWMQVGSSTAIKTHDAFLNFTDGKAYTTKKAEPIPNVEGLIEALARQIAEQ